MEAHEKFGIIDEESESASSRTDDQASESEVTQYQTVKKKAPPVSRDFIVIDGIPWSILKHAIFEPSFDSQEFLVSSLLLY